MKKQFGLTLMALLTAFSSMAFAAQGNEVSSHNSEQNSNDTIFLTDSEMQDAVGGGYKPSCLLAVISCATLAKRKLQWAELHAS